MFHFNHCLLLSLHISTSSLFPKPRDVLQVGLCVRRRNCYTASVPTHAHFGGLVNRSHIPFQRTLCKKRTQKAARQPEDWLLQSAIGYGEEPGVDCLTMMDEPTKCRSDLKGFINIAFFFRPLDVFFGECASIELKSIERKNSFHCTIRSRD